MKVERYTEEDALKILRLNKWHAESVTDYSISKLAIAKKKVKEACIKRKADFAWVIKEESKNYLSILVFKNKNN
jgi:hypothetical protein